MHPPYAIYVLGSPFSPPMQRSSLVYLLVWNALLHTPYISSPNHYLLFATHAHTIATCFAEVAKLCHLFLISHLITLALLTTVHVYKLYLLTLISFTLMQL